MAENIIHKIKIADVEYALQDQSATNSIQEINQTLSGKADSNHNHDDAYDAKGSAETALATSKEYTDNKVASMVFIGTYAEYRTAYANGQIAVNAIVILTDDESSGDLPSTSTSSKLGEGALGFMVLA